MIPRVIHRRMRRSKNKRMKQEAMLREMIVPTTQYKFSRTEIDNEIIVIDGGTHPCPPICPPKGIKWRSISIQDLHIEDETNGSVGLSYPKMNGISPFICLPRAISLDIISNIGLSQIYDALHECQALRLVSLRRSDRKQIFTDHNKPVSYACVGPQPSRNSNIVRDYPPFMEGLHDQHLEILVWMMKRAEIAFRSFANHHVISHLHHAKKIVPFKTFISKNDTPSPYSADFFGGIGFGTNVFLHCHTDDDFTMSIIQVFLKGRMRYHLDDHIVTYFCFPTLGVAVPLRPGDYFIFNALIPHCISSRCHHEDEIISTAFYLKTAVVGLNNNNLPLTEGQELLYKKLRYKGNIRN